jgi:hypothetical protein
MTENKNLLRSAVSTALLGFKHPLWEGDIEEVIINLAEIHIAQEKEDLLTQLEKEIEGMKARSMAGESIAPYYAVGFEKACEEFLQIIKAKLTNQTK